MKTKVPAAFRQKFVGPEGAYTVLFTPTDDWDGIIDVSIGGLDMRWQVLNAEQEANGAVVLGGTTDGSPSLWGDQFWFELRFEDAPPLIRYWGNQVIWREDRAS
jgi:hypothetical protein